MARISTHVLDAARGQPAAGVQVVLQRLNGGAEETVAVASTDEQGRIADLAGEIPAGAYRLSFLVGERFGEEPHLYRAVHLDVDVAAGHHHLPLLLGPYSCTTYRGS